MYCPSHSGHPPGLENNVKLRLQVALAKARELTHSDAGHIPTVQQPGEQVLTNDNLSDLLASPKNLFPLPHYILTISRLFNKLSKYLKKKDQAVRQRLRNLNPLQDQELFRLAGAGPPKKLDHLGEQNPQQWLMLHPHFSRFGRTSNEARWRRPEGAGLGCSEDTTVETEEKSKREDDMLYFTRMGKQRKSACEPHTQLGPTGGRDQGSSQTKRKENKVILMAKRAGQICLGEKRKTKDKLFFTRTG